VTHANLSGKSRRFLNCSEAVVKQESSKIVDSLLNRTLENGIGYIHNNQSNCDKEIVEKLYRNCAIQVLVTSAEKCWGLCHTSHLVVVMGTQYYDGTEYSVFDLLQMIGKANRPALDENSFCALFCYGPRKKYYESFLLEPFPIESQINRNLQNHFNAEIVADTIEEKQDAVDYLTWTFYYRRLSLNPNYYNLIGNSHRHVSDHLSELVDTTFEDLSRSRCVIIEEHTGKVESTNFGRIAAYYCISYTAIEILSASLHINIKQKGIIDIICASSDFKDLHLLPEEENFILDLLTETQIQHSSDKHYPSCIKVNALLYAYFSRIPVIGCLVIEQQSILLTCTRLVYALVDIIATKGWLAPLIAAMELAQMIVQGQWSTDSPLLQLPHFSKSLVENCLKTLNNDSIYEFLLILRLKIKKIF